MRAGPTAGAWAGPPAARRLPDAVPGALDWPSPQEGADMEGSQETGQLRFEVLGPLQVLRGGKAVELGPPRQRAVLATLLLHANHPLSRDRFVSAVWGPDVPEYAVNLLQKHVSRLRRSLAPPGADPAASDR